MSLWVCVDHERPEGTCRECSVVQMCPPERRFTPDEVEAALDRARELSRAQERQRVKDALREVGVVL